MGLCKCPLKKVTNLFCFEHRVNVCDHCLLSNHAQCIVQTYLKWLQDSDYTPNCGLCDSALVGKQTVRLLCLHVFHKHCLTKHAQSLPPTTAPASYTCLTCQEGVFPNSSNKSPIAEALRNSLATETWARPGLGLPVKERAVESSLPAGLPTGPPQLTSTPAPVKSTSVVEPVPMAATTTSSHPLTPDPVQPDPQKHPSPQPPPSHSVVKKTDSIPVGVVAPVTGSYDRSKTVVDTTNDSDTGRSGVTVSAFDCDEDKYRRRSLREWLTRWFRLHSGVSSKSRDDPLSRTLRRWIVILIICLLSFFTVIFMLTRVSSEHSALGGDPFVNLGRDKVQINPK